ncbi:sodium transporter HKT1-like isoform X2 [Benincasa hispida]|uniref:sodium transporter HKT1-like isoform X2 n=1 Tax=Benincasa hispida TaxID=102211 RepID=UPI0019002894|nr:sodium transporter HKT1-like isoform X2 [Benincasa hispida]
MSFTPLFFFRQISPGRPSSTMKNLPLYFLRSPPSLRLPLLAANPFFSHLSYFLTISLLGFGALKLTKTRTSSSPNDLNIFFTSVSAVSVSSMSVVEMEVFSNFQLIIITTLMFLGGEVFVSAVGFQLSRWFQQLNEKNRTDSIRAIEMESGTSSSTTATVDEILLGGCLYPVGLWLAIMAAAKLTGKKEWRYILKNYSEMGYSHLLSGLRCGFLAVTAVGFIILQLIIFCSLEWNNSAGIWDGLNPYQKFMGSLFQVTNSRHTGESVVDISVISPAILVVFVVMMYLPPYTTFLPMRNKEITSRSHGKDKRQHLVELFTFSQLSYLAIFIILICITEKEKLRDDPLNFTVLNITLEVISAYGNVGFSSGYSCKRQVKVDRSCKDAWYGFAGRWSAKGKFILILVMIFGRMKTFTMHTGQAWKLS